MGKLGQNLGKFLHDRLAKLVRNVIVLASTAGICRCRQTQDDAKKGGNEMYAAHTTYAKEINQGSRIAYFEYLSYLLRIGLFMNIGHTIC